MKKIMILTYGVLVYLFFFLTFLYLIGFVGNVFVPKSIDSGVQGPVASAVMANILLMSLFGLQHSIMARPGFKDRWRATAGAAATTGILNTPWPSLWQHSMSRPHNFWITCGMCASSHRTP